MIRALLVVVSAVLGTGFGLTLSSACSSAGSCHGPLALPLGEREIRTVELSQGADHSLRDITITDVVVRENALDVLYHRGGTPGLVTYRAQFTYVDGTATIVDAGAPSTVDAGDGR